jgi:hypothetical protein
MARMAFPAVIAASLVLASADLAAAEPERQVESGSLLAPDGTVIARPGEVEAVQKPRLRLGMTKEDVLLKVMGKPTKTVELETPNGPREKWIYPSGRTLYFHKGVLVGIEAVAR